MRQTRTLFFGSIALIAALASTALAQQQQTVAPPLQQAPQQQRGRGAVQQQPQRDAAKAAKQEAQLPRKLAGDAPKLTQQQQRNKTANAVVARYIGGFQKNVGLTDEQTQKFSVVLGNYVRRQLTLAQNRTDAYKHLKELTDRQASQEEIETQNSVIETTESQQATAKNRFFAQINPELTPEQRGKLKVYLESTAQDIHQAIQKSAQ